MSSDLMQKDVVHLFVLDAKVPHGDRRTGVEIPLADDFNGGAVPNPLDITPGFP